MKELRQELQWQMESLHRRYDCARKVPIKNPDLQKLPLRQAQGALQKLWGDYTYSKMSNRMASKTCLLYTSPSPRDRQKSRMPSSA